MDDVGRFGAWYVLRETAVTERAEEMGAFLRKLIDTITGASAKQPMNGRVSMVSLSMYLSLAARRGYF